jgi:hypothetical protein
VVRVIEYRLQVYPAGKRSTVSPPLILESKLAPAKELAPRNMTYSFSGPALVCRLGLPEC